MDKDLSQNIGSKVREYRKKAGISQFDLETEIGASAGSLSRIENGEVNPTKETLSKISKVLNLKSSEVADLIGIEILTTEELVLAIQSLSSSLDLNTTLQTAVDIMFELFPNYNGGIVFLRNTENSNTFRARTISRQIPNLKKFLKYLPVKLDRITIDITKHNNFAIESIKMSDVRQSGNLYDFAKDIVNKFVSDSIQKISGFKHGITIPMLYEHDVVGITFFTKCVNASFSQNEIQLLKLLTGQITTAIMNARKFEELKKELQLLKNRSV